MNKLQDADDATLNLLDAVNSFGLVDRSFDIFPVSDIIPSDISTTLD